MNDESKAGEQAEQLEAPEKNAPPKFKEPTNETSLDCEQTLHEKKLIHNLNNKWRYFKKLKGEIKFWLEVAGIAGGLAVGVLIFFQYKEMIRTNILMRETLITDERAWLAPTGVSIEPAQGSNYCRFKLTFKNTGKTPALNVATAFNCGIITATEVPTNDPPASFSASMVAPDGISFVFSDLYGWDTPAMIKNGIPFYFYGKISYDDIFGEHHWTQFCWTAQIDGQFQPATIHNSCDGLKK